MTRTDADIIARFARDAVEPEMVAVYRAMTPAQKLQIVNGMWRSARDMLSRLLAAEHPDWSPEQVRQAVAERMAHRTD